MLSDDFQRADGSPGSSWDFQIYSPTGPLGTAAVTDNRLVISGGEYYALRHATTVTGDSLRITVVATTMAGAYADPTDIGVGASAGIPLAIGGVVSLNGAQGLSDLVTFDDFMVERRE